MKPIIHVPNDVLNTPAKTVTTFDKKLSNLVIDMTKTLKATKKPKGVGLAAPQIGESYRVFITKPTPKSEIRVFVNPHQLDDYQSYNLAKDIARRIEAELQYPGEIKVMVIRESRVIEYAK